MEEKRMTNDEIKKRLDEIAEWLIDECAAGIDLDASLEDCEGYDEDGNPKITDTWSWSSGMAVNMIKKLKDDIK